MRDRAVAAQVEVPAEGRLGQAVLPDLSLERREIVLALDVSRFCNSA